MFGRFFTKKYFKDRFYTKKELKEMFLTKKALKWYLFGFGLGWSKWQNFSSEYLAMVLLGYVVLRFLKRGK